MSFIFRFSLFTILVFFFNSEISCLHICNILNENFLENGYTLRSFQLPSRPFRIYIEIELSINSIFFDRSQLPFLSIYGFESDTIERMRRDIPINFLLVYPYGVYEVQSIYLDGSKFCQNIIPRYVFAPSTILITFNLTLTNNLLGLLVSQDIYYFDQYSWLHVYSNRPNEDMLSARPDTDVLAKNPNTDVLAKNPNTDVLAKNPNTDVLAKNPNTDVLAKNPNTDVLAKNPNTDVLATSPNTDIFSATAIPDIDILSANPNTDSTNDESSSQETIFNFNYECGKREQVNYETILGGIEILPNEFPWLVALSNSSRKYFCAGTLVSDRHVISAAHCTINMSVVHVELGRHRLDELNEKDAIILESKKIINHPNYVQDTGHADISLIITTETIPFSNIIRPICIWTRESRDVDEIGTVVGWGVDISGSYTKVPMAVEIHSVSNADCLSSSAIYRNITSNTTFCAGGDRKGPCLGDSGSGFVVEKNNIWYLKGVLSLSIKSGSACDVSKYSVYCDVGKYLNWIQKMMANV